MNLKDKIESPSVAVDALTALELEEEHSGREGSIFVHDLKGVFGEDPNFSTTIVGLLRRLWEQGRAGGVAYRTTQEAARPESFSEALVGIFENKSLDFPRLLVFKLLELWMLGFQFEDGTRCECCGLFEGVETESSRTMYSWDGQGEDPNRPLRLCRSCAAEHHEHWDEMWEHARPTL